MNDDAPEPPETDPSAARSVTRARVSEHREVIEVAIQDLLALGKQNGMSDEEIDDILREILRRRARPTFKVLRGDA